MSGSGFKKSKAVAGSLSFKKLLECLGEDWDGGNDSFVETTAPKSEADMRAWALPEDLTDVQRCIRFLQSDKMLQQQLGVQMLPRVAAQAHLQVLPVAMSKVQAMKDDVEFLVMSGEAFRECVEDCDQLLSAPVAASVRQQLWDLSCEMAFHDSAEVSSVWEEVVLCIVDRLPISVLSLLLPLDQLLKMSDVSQKENRRSLCVRIIGCLCSRVPLTDAAAGKALGLFPTPAQPQPQPPQQKQLHQLQQTQPSSPACTLPNAGPLIDRALSLCQDTSQVVRGHTARQLHQLSRVSGDVITNVLLMEELHELLKDEEEEVRADAFVGAIDLFPAVAQQQQLLLLSEFKNVLASCCEEATSSTAARAFNRCVVRYTGPLFITLDRFLCAEEADCSFFLTTIKRFACEFGPDVRALVAFNMPAFYTAFGPSKNTHLFGTLQRLLHDRECTVRVAAAKTMGVISGMMGTEQRQGVFADTFLKLFEDSDEPTLMAALQSFQQAGPHLAGILPSLTARSLCNALVGIVSAKELAWRQQLAAALAFRHASQWATNQLVADVVLPCLIKLLKDGAACLREQVSSVLASVLAMSRSFGTRISAMEVIVRDFARSSSFQHRLTYCLICAAAAQEFSVSFNASHLLPPLIDLMQDPVVNVRLKVCAMARDVCVIAKLGCVAEAGEESRLDRVKAILASCSGDRDSDLRACAQHVIKNLPTFDTSFDSAADACKREDEERVQQLEAGSSRKRLLDAVRNRGLPLPTTGGRMLVSAKKTIAAQKTVAAGSSAAAEDKKPKGAGAGAGAAAGGGCVASAPAAAKAGDERRGSSSDALKFSAVGTGPGSISDVDRKKMMDANAARASSAPGATGNPRRATEETIAARGSTSAALGKK